MNKDLLTQRVAELRSRQQQLLNEAHVVEGAIQNCLFWISELDKPVVEDEEKKD